MIFHRRILIIAFLLIFPILGVGMFAGYRYLQPTQTNPLVAQNEVYDVPIRIEEVARGLFVPWSFVFTDPRRILVTERSGAVRVIFDGKLQDEPLAQFEVSMQSEEGLMGMDIDPDYAENKFIYLCVAYEKSGGLVNKVVRARDTGRALTQEETILDDIPSARFHAGCRVRFGPDGKLYVSTGDASKKELAQDKDSLAGKILRMNADGTIPDDNPYKGSYVYSYGHRNVQGFDWSSSGNLIATEHGPSGFDGPGGGDEVNLIRAGENYGWPLVSHERKEEGLVDPLLVYTPAIAPASGSFYTSRILPQFTNTYLFGMLRGSGIMYVVFDPDRPARVVKHHPISGIDVGRVRDVAEGPDGFIYFSTSNRDGRGDVREGDDKIYRIVPER